MNMSYSSSFWQLLQHVMVDNNIYMICNVERSTDFSDTEIGVAQKKATYDAVKSICVYFIRRHPKVENKMEEEEEKESDLPRL